MMSVKIGDEFVSVYGPLRRAVRPVTSFLAVAIAFSTLAVAAAAIFRRGRWKKVVV